MKGVESSSAFRVSIIYAPASTNYARYFIQSLIYFRRFLRGRT